LAFDVSRKRPLPASRLLRTSLRTLHLISFGALYGGHVFAVAAERLYPALAATLASGGALMALEMYRTPVWPVQVRGVATFVKVLLVAAVGLWWDARVWLLTMAIVIGGVVSHMPGKYRYYSLLHGRVVGDSGERG
jgi:hypothetical protein